MEVRGEPGAVAYVKATVRAIQIRESGTSYFVQLDGRDDWHEVDANDILFETDPEEMLEAEKKIEELKEMPAVKFEEPEAPKRRGRPKKANVEDLMKRAEQARFRAEIRKEIEEE